jgi:hypothetical protein
MVIADLRSLYLILLGIVCHFCNLPATHADESARVLLLSDADKSLAAWEEKAFMGRTTYELLQQDGNTFLRARSSGTASGLYRKQKVDLQDYPYLNWRWKINRRLAGLDETSKTGDDYAARIYVIVKDGLLFWKTRAICYVWSANMQKGSVWDNAYAGESVKMVAVRSSGDELEKWYEEKRNVFRDFARLFGVDVSEIDSIAVMVDTDNSQQEATGYYANINFSAR